MNTPPANENLEAHLQAARDEVERLEQRRIALREEIARLNMSLHEARLRYVTVQNQYRDRSSVVSRQS